MHAREAGSMRSAIIFLYTRSPVFHCLAWRIEAMIEVAFQTSLASWSILVGRTNANQFREALQRTRK